MPANGNTNMEAMERAYAASPWGPPPEPTPAATIAAVNTATVAEKDSPFKVTGGNSLSSAETLRRLGAFLGAVTAQGNTVERTSPEYVATPPPPPAPDHTLRWIAVAVVIAVVIYLVKE